MDKRQKITRRSVGILISLFVIAFGLLVPMTVLPGYGEYVSSAQDNGASAFAVIALSIVYWLTLVGVPVGSWVWTYGYLRNWIFTDREPVVICCH